MVVILIMAEFFVLLTLFDEFFGEFFDELFFDEFFYWPLIF